MLKTLGYLVSTLSVILLGITSWKSASEHPTLMACLLGGMASSVGGMLLRWLSYVNEQREKQQKQQGRPIGPLEAAGETVRG